VDCKALSPAQLVLHCLKAGDESAWIEFVHRFHPLIARVVTRVAWRWGESSREVLDDLVQETYLKLCTNRETLLQRFQVTDDSIFGFVKVFTANLVHDHFKAAHSTKRGGGAKTEPADDQTSSEQSGNCSFDSKSIERSVLLGQIDSCLREEESGPNAWRDRQIFWLYYRVGLSASAIAALPAVGLSTKGVESTILRMTQVVRRRLARAEDSAETEGDPSKGIRPAESF
jgi:RNA polymerase sigma-70 factor (ECF subfamily)